MNFLVFAFSRYYILQMRNHLLKIFFYLVFLTALTIPCLELLSRHKFQETKFARDWVYHPVLGHSGPKSETVMMGQVANFYNDLGFRSEATGSEATGSGSTENHINSKEAPRNRGPLKGATSQAHALSAHESLQKKSILILGDSMTEASTIPRAATFAGLIPSLLSPTQVNVHTFASPDYGTLNELLAYDLYQERIAPDIVLLQFLGLNDFVNNTLAFAGRNKSESDFARPYVIPNSASNSTRETYRLGSLPITFASPIRSWLLEHSALFRTIYAYYISQIWKYAEVHGYPEDPCPVEVEMFLDESSKGWREGIEATQMILQELKALAKNKGLMGIYLPSNIETDEDLWTNGIVPQLQRCFPGKAYDRFQGEKRFLALAKKANIAAFSLREAIWEATKDHKTEGIIYAGGHFTILGHKIAADAIVKQLKNSSLLKLDK